MGTWDSGLYDNDSALDVLGELMDEFPSANSPAELVAGIGLRLWLYGDDLQSFQDALEQHSDWVSQFEGATEALAEFAERDEHPTTRPDKVRRVLGGYCAGVRIPALLRIDGANAVIAALATACREHLNSLVEQTDNDLYELAGELSPMGVLIELDSLRPELPADEVDAWERAFELANRQTPDEREFWDEYVERVRAGFQLLRTPCEPDPW